MVTLRLAETFTISRSSEDEADVVQVEMRHGGVSGFGEAAPIERYDESAASALAWLDRSKWATTRSRSTRSGRLPPGEQAARSAVDAALHDLQGKLTGLPVLQAARPARAPGRRRRGRSGSATRTTWRGAPRRSPRAGSSG